MPVLEHGIHVYELPRDSLGVDPVGAAGQGVLDRRDLRRINVGRPGDGLRYPFQVVRYRCPVAGVSGIRLDERLANLLCRN